ncbi:MAG: hypothetical protein JWR26_4823 [Pedosphaera sp.]|nr:hypothetical protein [Pedosphaera sp.]
MFLTKAAPNFNILHIGVVENYMMGKIVAREFRFGFGFRTMART